MRQVKTNDIAPVRRRYGADADNFLTLVRTLMDDFICGCCGHVEGSERGVRMHLRELRRTQAVSKHRATLSGVPVGSSYRTPNVLSLIS